MKELANDQIGKLANCFLFVKTKTNRKNRYHFCSLFVKNNEVIHLQYFSLLQLLLTIKNSHKFDSV